MKAGDRNPICETFAGSLGPHWRTHVVGAGLLDSTEGSLRFVTSGAAAETYTNAQIDDYQGLPRGRFAWRPPLRLTVRARFSHAADRLHGTAGFGFWNDPLLVTQKRLPALPRALWFFYASPPSDIKLDTNTPGNGWKAASIDAQRTGALIWAPLGPLLVPLMNLRSFYRALWPHIQRSMRIREAPIPVDMARWHTYVLHWDGERAHFSVAEGAAGHSTPLLSAPSPRGPLGFVMWQDNQYLVLTPWGRIQWGLLDVPNGQWMEVDYLEISPLQGSGP
jgi:hypothetical protein